jgi:hypothetical protein
MTDKTQRLINGLGLTFKIITALMFGAGVMGLLMYAIMTAITGGEFPPKDGSEAQLSPLLLFLLQHYALLALAQVLVAAGLFYTSFQFVKLRRWARNVLEKFAWLSGGFVICFAMFIIIFPPFNLPSLVKFGMAASMGFWLIPVAIVIWLLRKREVKEAFENS